MTSSSCRRIIWIRRGNCSTKDIERALRDHADDIREFLADEEASFLALS